MVSAIVCACMSAGQSAILGTMSPLIFFPEYTLEKTLTVGENACSDLKTASAEFIELTGINCKES